MSKRVSDEDRIQHFFMTAGEQLCKLVFDRIEAVMKTRGFVPWSAKPVRKSRAKGQAAELEQVAKPDPLATREELFMTPGGKR